MTLFFGRFSFCFDFKTTSSTGTVRALGLLKALAPVVWFSSFTAMVIVNKWLVLGAQAQWRVPLGTHAYLAWWYTNAMLNVWETIGGRWLLDTKLIILFYRVMGAKVSRLWESVRCSVLIDVCFKYILPTRSACLLTPPPDGWMGGVAKSARYNQP